MLYIVLIEPENPGNIGAIARLMGNFSLKNLILINPKADHLSEEARNRAKHAQKVLESAKLATMGFLKKMDYIYGTTSKLGSSYNVPRTPIDVKDLPSKLSRKKNNAILFGSEGNGLTNEQISLCDVIVNIPTSNKYPALNLSHAAAIVFYELSRGAIESNSSFIPAGKKEKEHLIKSINSTIDSLGFSTPEKKRTQKVVWKRIINKATLSNREAFALFGFFRKLKRKQ